MNHSKRTLSRFRRSSALRILSILVLALMCAPLAFAASVSSAMAPPTLAMGGGFGLGSLAIVGGIAGLGLLMPEGEQKGGGGGGTNEDEKPLAPEAALAQMENPTLTMGQRLKVAASALRGIPPAEQFTKVQADLATAQATITAKDAEIATLNAKLKTSEETLAARVADIEALDTNNVALAKRVGELEATEKDLTKRASTQAKGIVQSIGIEASSLPAAQADTTEKPEDRIRALTGSQRTQAALYFQTHKKLPDWM